MLPDKKNEALEELKTLPDLAFSSPKRGRKRLTPRKQQQQLRHQVVLE
jgi:hypothetical protein